MSKLVACPICRTPPDRFFVSKDCIEVIACPKGCKPGPFAFAVHITSKMAEGRGWDDLGDCWNTIRIVEEDGRRFTRFDAYPSGKRQAQKEAPGPHLKWSPEISQQHVAVHAAPQPSQPAASEAAREDLAEIARLNRADGEKCNICGNAITRHITGIGPLCDHRWDEFKQWRAEKRSADSEGAKG